MFICYNVVTMADAILKYFSEMSGAHVILITLLVAMIPIIELKGAIPFGASTKFWSTSALSVWESFAYAYLGSAIISVLLVLCFKKVLALLMKLKITRKIADKIKLKLNRHKEDIDSQVEKSKSTNTRLIKALAIFAFVAVPLPLTGVWTGACLCTVLNMPLLDSMISVLVGNLVCGLIVTLVSKQFEAYTHIILIVVLILAVVLFLGKMLISKIKHRHDNSTTESVDTIIVDNE